MSHTSKIIITSLLLFSCLIAAGQRDLRFYPINMSNGLSSNKVRSVCRNKSGYIWIATSNGLNRYDGNRFRTYYSSFDPANIRTNNFWNVKEDANGVLWIDIDYKDYILYYSKDDRFDKNYVAYLEKLGLKRKLNNPSIQLDNNGNLWIWDEKGLEHHYFGNNTWKHYDIFDIERIFARNNKVYILQNDLNIKITSFDAKSIKNDVSLKQQAKNFNGTRARLFVDSENGIWTYSRTNDQLYYKKAGVTKWHNFADDPDCPELDIRDITESDNGEIMIAMGHHALCYYDKQTGKIVPYDRKHINLPEGSVTRIFSDQNIMIAGFEHNGIAVATKPLNGIGGTILNEAEVSSINNIKTTSMVLDQEDNLWMGTDGDGIYVLNLKTHKITHKKIENRLNVVVNLYCDKKNRIWVCTFCDGVYIYDNSDSTPTHYRKGQCGLADDNVWCATEDADGRIWIGDLNEGLQMWDETNKHFLSPSIPSTTILDIALAPDNFLIVATPNGHLDFNPKTHKYETCASEKKLYEEYGIPDKHISHVTFDSRGWLWEGGNNGVFVKNKFRASFTHIGMKEGLCNQVIHGIVEDREHNMWISTENGLSRIVLKKGTKDPDIANFTIYNYGIIDGLKSNQFNNGALALIGNNILAGTDNGICRIIPKELPVNHATGKIHITELHIGSDSICASVDPETTYRIPSDETNFAVYFSVLDNYSHSNWIYGYRLNSSEKWAYTQSPELIFSHQSPGDYTLELCVKNGPVTRLNIHVCYPWWRTWWAYTLYIILAIGMWHTYKRVRRQRKALLDTISEMQRGIQLAMEKRQNERLRAEIETSNVEPTDADNDLKKQVISVIESNMDNSEFTVQELSAQVGMSRANLHRKLVSITGKGPLEFIRSVRLIHSQQLLIKTQMTIAEISYAVGFNNPKNYSRYFKEEFGMTPSQYREEQKE